MRRALGGTRVCEWRRRPAVLSCSYCLAWELPLRRAVPSLGAAEDGGPRFGAGCVALPASHGPRGGGEPAGRLCRPVGKSRVIGMRQSCRTGWSASVHSSLLSRAPVLCRVRPMLSFPRAPHRCSASMLDSGRWHQKRHWLRCARHDLFSLGSSPEHKGALSLPARSPAAPSAQPQRIPVVFTCGPSHSHWVRSCHCGPKDSTELPRPVGLSGGLALSTEQVGQVRNAEDSSAWFPSAGWEGKPCCAPGCSLQPRG